MPPLRLYPQALEAFEDIIVAHIDTVVQTQECGYPPVTVRGMLLMNLFHGIKNFPTANGRGRATATEPLVIPSTTHACYLAEKFDGILMRQTLHDFELRAFKRTYSFLPSLPVWTV